MTQSTIQNAVSHLQKTERGSKALSALADAIPRLIMLDSGNQKACCDIIAGLFGDYTGTVIDSVCPFKTQKRA